MNDLPGNPFVPDPDKSDTADGRNVTYATLALAFEQRTANLIATADLHASLGRSGLAYPIMEQISARLGMTEES